MLTENFHDSTEHEMYKTLQNLFFWIAKLEGFNLGFAGLWRIDVPPGRIVLVTNPNIRTFSTDDDYKDMLVFAVICFPGGLESSQSTFPAILFHLTVSYA